MSPTVTPEEAAHTHAAKRSAALLSVFAALIITLLKLLTGIFTGSLGMLSEAAHSVSDTCNELFLVASVRRSERPADDRHPFGYGAERFFWSLIAAVGIFVAGGGFSLFQAYRSFVSPPGRGEWVLEYVVLGLAGLFEAVSFAGRCTRSARRRPTPGGPRSSTW